MMTDHDNKDAAKSTRHTSSDNSTASKEAAQVMHLSQSMEREMERLVANSIVTASNSTATTPRPSGGSGVNAVRALHEGSSPAHHTPRDAGSRLGTASTSRSTRSLDSINESASSEQLLNAFDRGQRELFFAHLQVLLGSPESVQDIFAADSRPVSRHSLAEASEKDQEELMHRLQAAAVAGAPSPRLLEFQIRIHFLMCALRDKDCGSHRLLRERLNFQTFCRLNMHHLQAHTNILKYCALGYVEDISACGASFHELLAPKWTSRLRAVFVNWLREKVPHLCIS